MEKQDTDPSNESSSLDMSDFLATLTSKSPDEVVISLQDKSQAIVIRVLESLNPAVAQDVLAKFPEDSLKAIMDAAAD